MNFYDLVIPDQQRFDEICMLIKEAKDPTALRSLLRDTLNASAVLGDALLKAAPDTEVSDG